MTYVSLCNNYYLQKLYPNVQFTAYNLPCHVAVCVEPEDINTCTCPENKYHGLNRLSHVNTNLSGVFCWTITQNKGFLLRFKRLHLSGTRSKALNDVYHTWPHVRTREWNEDIAPADQVQDKEREKKKDSSIFLSVYTCTTKRKLTRH